VKVIGSCSAFHHPIYILKPIVFIELTEAIGSSSVSKQIVPEKECRFDNCPGIPLFFGDGITWSFASLDFEENMNALAQALSCKTIAVFGATGETDVYVDVPSFVTLVQVYQKCLIRWRWIGMCLPSAGGGLQSEGPRPRSQPVSWTLSESEQKMSSSHFDVHRVD
jgi:hypothetical protein